MTIILRLSQRWLVVSIIVMNSVAEGVDDPCSGGTGSGGTGSGGTGSGDNGSGDNGSGDTVSGGTGSSGTGSGQYPTNNGCHDDPVLVTVVPWPPYDGNASEVQKEKAIKEFNETFSDCCNVKVSAAANEKELLSLIKANETDIGFPVIKRGNENQSPDETGTTKDNCSIEHPGLDFLVYSKQQSPGKVCMDTLKDSWPVIALSIVLTGIAAVIIWVLEAVGNREEFPGSFAKGAWEGFWWAFISMTTVGYGDKCPRSVVGRCFAIVWIFAGIILVAVFMANVTAALTSASVQNDHKIREVKLGVLKKSLEKTIATKEENAKNVEDFDSYEELIKAFRDGNVIGILMDHIAAGYHLKNLSHSIRDQIVLKRHIKLEYCVDVNVSKKYQSRMKTTKGNQLISCKISNLFNDWKTEAKEGFEGIKNRSTVRSFNLFIDSKQTLIEATYITTGILAGLIFIGIVIERICLKRKLQISEEQELKVPEDFEIIQDIARGKEMLTQLQEFLQEMEEKVNKNYFLKYSYECPLGTEEKNSNA